MAMGSGGQGPRGTRGPEWGHVGPGPTDPDGDGGRPAGGGAARARGAGMERAAAKSRGPLGRYWF